MNKKGSDLLPANYRFSLQQRMFFILTPYTAWFSLISSVSSFKQRSMSHDILPA